MSYLGITIGFIKASCLTKCPHLRIKLRVLLSFCFNHSSVSLFFINTSPLGFLLAPSANLLPLQVIWYTNPLQVWTNSYPANTNLLNMSESSFDCGAYRGSWPPIFWKSDLYIAHGAKIPSVVLVKSLNLSKSLNSCRSSNSSGSIP